VKVSELIAQAQALLDKHGDVAVIASWEGVVREPTLYRNCQGELVIDADCQAYRYGDEHPDDVDERISATGADKIEVVVEPYGRRPGWFTAEVPSRPDIHVLDQRADRAEAKARASASLPPPRKYP
jgi:hypothetical protein